MNTRLLPLAALLVILVGCASTLAPTKPNRAAKEFMRDKLALAQKVLEGLATENYPLMTANGARLSAMTRETGWRLFGNTDYDQQSLAFRRQADALVKAAGDKNLDAATLAYVRLTISCVDCHKLVRGKFVATADGSRALTLAAAHP
jgi:hypothetical protein